jgi:hypothetical protein
MKFPIVAVLPMLLACPAAAAQRESVGFVSGGGESAKVADIYARTSLPAGTPILLEVAQTITTEGGDWEEGDQFSLKVSEDVVLGEFMIIPQGTLAYGHVRWSTRSGTFGKSGKIEVTLDRLVLGGKDVGLSGIHREEGRGQLTKIGAVVAAGPLAGLITGENAKITKGSILTAYLREDLGVIIPYRAWSPDLAVSGGPMVRARQITVAEAFSDAAIPTAKPNPRENKARRVTVAEAFSSGFPPKKKRDSQRAGSGALGN